MRARTVLISSLLLAPLLSLTGPAQATSPSPATSSSCSLKPGPSLKGNPTAKIDKSPGPAAGHAVKKSITSNGQWLLDQQGRVVILHGTNEVMKLAPYTPSSTGFGAADVTRMAQAGFNAVRVGVIWKALEPNPGKYNLRYLADLAGTVKLLTDRKINVILDFHQDMMNEQFDGEGFPDWAVKSDGLPTLPNCGFPENYFVMPALQVAWNHFWANDYRDSLGRPIQTAYADAWKVVAKQFRGDRYVTGYDIFNEPFPGTAWALCLLPTGCSQDNTLESFERRVMTGIRAVDPNTTLYYEPWVTFGSGGGTSMGDPGIGNSGFSFHDYCVTGITGLGPNTPGIAQICDKLAEQIPLNFAAQRAKAHLGAPLMSEFGAVQDAPVITRIANSADQHMASWLSWAWFNEDPSGPRPNEGIIKDPAKPPTGSNINTALIDALTRPYPRAIAGTPTSFGYNPTSGMFTLSYSTTRARGGRFAPGARTVIFAPTQDYPRGSRIQLTGARIIAHKGDLLTIASTRGATQVSLTISRR